MASGATLCLFNPLANEAPSASYATYDWRNGHPCLDFDAAADENAIFSFVLPANYAGGGLTLKIHWAATSATSGSCRWLAAIEAVVAQDIDADGFATANSNGGTANGTSGIATVTSITFTSGGQMDSLVAGGLGRLKITRDADGTSGTDDMTGVAEFLYAELLET